LNVRDWEAGITPLLTTTGVPTAVAVPAQLEPAKYSYVTVPPGVKVSAPARVAESVTEPPTVIVEAESVVEMDRVALITVTV
jgi:hypothetical protein